jgi:hypothetical protein
LQQTGDEILGIGRDVVPELRMKFVFSFADFAEEKLIGLGIERGIATKQAVGDDSNGPHVHSFAVGFVGNKFRSDVT